MAEPPSSSSNTSAAATTTASRRSAPGQTDAAEQVPATYMPEKLRLLVTLFSALEFGLNSLSLYQHTPDFDAIKRAVESSSQSAFTMEHLQQILFFLPDAYAFATKQRDAAQPPVLTVRKRRLPGADAVHDTLTDRIEAFNASVQAFMERHVARIQAARASAGASPLSGEALHAELDKVELEKAPVPDVRDVQRAKTQQTLAAVATVEPSVSEQEMQRALEAPVPADLQSLPSWLIEKVRRQEQVAKTSSAKHERVQQERLVSTLPQLSDQLESYAIVKRKTTFPMSELTTSLTRAPIRGKVEEQIHLLESMVPFWVTVVCSDGKEYVKLSRKTKYNVVKATLKRLEDLTRHNDVLKQENELLESYLQRNAQSAGGSDDDEKRDEKDKKARQRRARAQVLLTMEQKNDLCSTELEAAQKELEETRRTSERLIDTLRAVLEETDIRIAELKKDAYEFKRDIVVGAENFRTGKTIAEKMIRYMEEKLRQKDAVVEKLRLKNATLKSQAQKIDAQLRHKEEMGDALHYIDFHQLQIENKQYVATIEERNEDLLKLKQTTGSTVQVLNSLKKRLHELLDESAWLQSEIQSRTELNEKILEEVAAIDERNQKDEKKLHKVQVQQSAEPSKDMPQILDYVAQKAKMYDLQQEIKNYERKVEIAERAARLARTRSSSVRSS